MRSGFTLTELLIVISIILILAAASIPAIQAFKGQRLDQGSRILISALNDARRRAITRRARHVVVMYSYDDPSDPIMKARHAMRVYMEPTGEAGTDRHYPGGYVGKHIVLPKGVQFSASGSVVRVWALGNLPDPAKPLPLDHPYFGKSNTEALVFERDGAIGERVDFPATHPGAGRNIYMPDEGCYQVPPDIRADICLIEVTPAGTEKVDAGKKRRNLIDLVPMTGRAVGKTFDISSDGFDYFGAP